MSNLKDLFSGKTSDKLLENSTGREVGSSVESADYLKSNVKDKKRFIPHVDFSSASNFAIFGSAEKYYEDAYDYIRKQYPYDGSLKEKINWSLSGTYLDRYIFENDYPRTTGYINFGESYGTPSTNHTGYDVSTKSEWIYFKGHNVNYSLNSETNPELTLQFDKLNIFNTASQGISNLELEGSGGISVEFWLRKPSFNSSNESRRQVIVDVWNSGSWTSAAGVSPSYGRFRVGISGSTTGNKVQPDFHVELLSGTYGFSQGIGMGPGWADADRVPSIVMSGSVLTGSSWNHFALTFINSGSQMTGRLYTNGDLTYTKTTGSTIGTITGSMLGQIGSLVADVSSSGVARGYGKLSASLDEFRFWKTRRTSEQIGKYWFTQVGGGTNTDVTLAATASTKYSYENPADLGVYYKFNEGIIDTSSVNSQDAVVLDYAGRVTNGEWEGYAVTSRNTGSAIMSASAASAEFADPILYSSHPLVSASLDNKKNVGKFHDETNNSSIYGTIPEWITSDDQNAGKGALQNLTQIMASYFDTLYLQTQAVPGLKNKDYISGSDKPFPFVNRFIEGSGFLTSEIFSKATDLEYLDARNNTKKFADKINELKNLIYKNIYNNLVYIYKSKGTEKSFRNLIRGFGVDKELVNIRLYGDEVTYKLEDNYDNSTVKKRYANFHSGTNLNAVVYQQTASGNTYSRGFISSSAQVQYRGNTYELESYFPPDPEKGTNIDFNVAFQTASIFGCHTSGAAGSTAWGTPDYGQFQVRSVRPDNRRGAAFFQLTCSNDGNGIIPNLTSSVFQDVYDGSRWNFAVRIKPKKYPLADGVSGSIHGQYDVEFSGYNYVLDVLNNSFNVTSSISAAHAQNFLKAKKRFFVGAHRTNTTGTVLQKSNVKSTSLRVWMDYLTSSALQAHAKDVTNFGSLNPYRDAYITTLNHSLGSKSVKAIPQLETLILDWDFATVTSSDAGGNFTVPDVSIASSGSNDYTGRWGWLGPIGQYQHTGYGFDFPASKSGSIDRRYVHTLELQPPEVINSSNMVSLIDEDQNKLFTKDTRPESYFFAFEKSMYDIMSKEILDIFATIVDFNNLIGEPVNRYRQEYKQMQKLRQLYFERLQNTLSLNKFVEYFKWIDSAISVMLQQLVPASAKFSENLRTMVESHVLERNKYWTKFPTLEMKQSDPEAGVFGINEMLYSGKRGLAPIPTTATASNCEWWHERANRDNSNITSGDSTIDTQRDKFRNADDFKSGSGPTLAISRKTTAITTTYEGQAYALRNFTKPYRLTVDESPEIHGGSNFPRGKTVEYAHDVLAFGTSNTLSIGAGSIPIEKGCTDIIEPTFIDARGNAQVKSRLNAKVTSSLGTHGYTSGKSAIFAPFSLFSSSISGGVAASIATGFKLNTEITNYHDDIYGDDKGIPAQGPFTERHVGGRQHRHINVNTGAADTTATRPEAWNLEAKSNLLTLSPRTSAEPRATMIRDEYAKRPVNIRNIKWGTSSAVVGNYRKDYQMVQTTGRTLNNRFFVDNEGFSPGVVKSPYVSGVIDFALPRYDLTGSNKFIFVNRFNAPGGPEASSRGSLDVYAEEYSVYSELNYRNLIVRNALKEWQTNHCGQFGIVSVSGTTVGYRQPYMMGYDTLASYHKTPRNGAHRGFYSSGNDREVEWILNQNTSIASIILSNYNRTLTGITSVDSKWGYGAYAKSNQKLETSGYFEIEVVDIGATSYEWAVGISSNDRQPGASGAGSIYWDYSFYHTTTAAQCLVKEGSTTRATISDLAVGDKLRILRDKGRVTFQRLKAGAINWIDVYRSTATAQGDYYPRAAFAGLDGAPSIINARISNPRYDNWFVQHPIPQSDLQYAWINNSYDVRKDQPFGFTGGSHDNDGIVPYTVPSVNTSITASSIQFVSASDLASYTYDPGGSHPIVNAWGVDKSTSGYTTVSFVDFAGMNTNIRETISSSANTLGFPLNTDGALYINDGGEGSRPSSFPVFSSFIGFYWDKNFYGSDYWLVLYQAKTLNALNLHRNGPYGYPSWKQIRTGETPVARYHKKNNILSLQTRPSWITLPKPSGSRPGQYYDTRKNSFTNYVEPPVTFKYRPLRSITSDADLKHTYANNKGLWTQRGLPLNNREKSIGEYLGGLNYKTDRQIYEKLWFSSEYTTTFQALNYSEVIFPREANTGLARTRGRIDYAESASWLQPLGKWFPPTASISEGSNGIDRDPNRRRTFWKDKDYERNRYSQPFDVKTLAYGAPYARFQTTISNSCGNQDGHARSVWPFGSDPIVYAPPGISGTYLRDTVSDVGAAVLSASSPNSMGMVFNDGRDTGELNSPNYYKLSGFIGGVTGSREPYSYSHICYIAPSASALYYWLPYYGNEEKTGSNHGISGDRKYKNPPNPVAYSLIVTSLMKGMRWRTAMDAGKNPWFDSYEEYAEDIRGLAKSWTILPEFRISDHMQYYVQTKNRNFRAKNDKFLSLNGATITQSADVADAQLSQPQERNFNENFFKEYSFSDFQKYFGTFANNYKLGNITLKCNAVKKLLPYKGFYPAGRTTQLVGLFSGALGQYVSGGALTCSTNFIKAGSGNNLFDVADDARVQSGSRQLALQSLLQPWFAPGILYNTIKSGIAVDWAVFTGSVGGGTFRDQVLGDTQLGPQWPGYKFYGNGAAGGGAGAPIIANTRFPFRSLLTPLEFIPQSRSDGSHRLVFQAPSYMIQDPSASAEPPRVPYAEFSPQHPPVSVTDLYASAMHNYLAEIPNFFLKDNSLQSIQSKQQGSLNIQNGKVYVMDAYIEKTNFAPNNELIMIQDYYNGYVSESFGYNVFGAGGVSDDLGTVWGTPGQGVTASYNGKYFGPKYSCIGGLAAAPAAPYTAWYQIRGAANSYPSYAGRDCDPAFAPSTPPYFYGKAKVRLIYTGSAEDAQTPGAGNGPNWRKILNVMTMSFPGGGPTADRPTERLDPRFSAWTKFGGTFNPSSSPAYQNIMQITASLNLKGLMVENPSDPSLNRWIISPYMETPVLDFSESQTPERGYGRGMWSGYGEIPNNKGIFFGIERVPNEFLNNSNIEDMTEWFRTPGDVSMFLNESGQIQSTRASTNSINRQVGQIANNKEISEAIVAIPFCTQKITSRETGIAKTTTRQIMGKNFFSLGATKTGSRTMFNEQKFSKSSTGKAIPKKSPLGLDLNLQEDIVETSISQMASLMDKYILPPNLDFNKYNDIEPFVMYIMEFTHELNQQDLVDIWQGLMPDISRTAELSDPADGEGVVSHPTAPYEFFGGKRLPASESIRWMVFKIKKQAHTNYWSMTPESEFGGFFSKSNITLNPLGLDYSYNWPYDYFSLVELAQIEVEDQFVIPTGPGGTVRATTRPATTAEVALRAANAQTGSSGGGFSSA